MLYSRLRFREKVCKLVDYVHRMFAWFFIEPTRFSLCAEHIASVARELNFSSSTHTIYFWREWGRQDPIKVNVADDISGNRPALFRVYQVKYKTTSLFLRILFYTGTVATNVLHQQGMFPRRCFHSETKQRVYIGLFPIDAIGRRTQKRKKRPQGNGQR